MVVPYLPQHEEADHLHLEPAIPPFAGRLGGNQDFIVDRHDPKNVEVLEKVPDAAPCMTLAEIFDLRGFYSADLWKFAFLECVGKNPLRRRQKDLLVRYLGNAIANLRMGVMRSEFHERLYFVLGHDASACPDHFPDHRGRRL